ncbi:MAG: nucleotide exchange factor GrpE [Nitrososphaerales archaeon]
MSRDSKAKAQLDELNRLREELQREKERAEEYVSKYKYLLADYDNYRKKLDKEAEIRVRLELGQFLLKLIGLRDDFTRSVEAAGKDVDNETIKSGLEGVLKNLDGILEEEGVTEIDAVGKPFDPRLHEAVSFEDNAELPENTVMNEIRKGYMLSERVIRPSLVVISKRPSKTEAEGEEKE